MASGVGFPLFPEFYIITQWSCSAAGLLWAMPDSYPGPLPQKSGPLPMSHHSSTLLCLTSSLINMNLWHQNKLLAPLEMKSSRFFQNAVMWTQNKLGLYLNTYQLKFILKEQSHEIVACLYYKEDTRCSLWVYCSILL